MDPISMDSLLAKLQAARDITSGLPAKMAPATKQVDFGAMLKNTLDSVNQTQASAASLAQKFQLGDPKVTLEDTMVTMQKANVSFQVALQVRNKVVQAYQSIMSLQI